MPLGAVCLQACQSPSGGEDPTQTQWHSIPSGIGPVKHKPSSCIPEGRPVGFSWSIQDWSLLFCDPANMFFPSQVFIDLDAKVWVRLRVDLLENETIQLVEMWCSAMDTEDAPFLGIKPSPMPPGSLGPLTGCCDLSLCVFAYRRQSSANSLTWEWDVTDSSNDTKQ